MLINEHKRSVIEYVVESDTVPTKEDIALTSLCIESPIGDYDLVGGLAFKKQLLEMEDFHSGDGKASYVKIFTNDGETIEIE
mgnify:CR=1 FL=1